MPAMSNSALAISLFAVEAIITPYHILAEPIGQQRVKISNNY
jgi:hypothetical protein